MSIFGLFSKRKPKAPLRFHNTLSDELEDFTPLNGAVRMYNCGPTVYGTQHIGNMRAAVFADILRRTLSLWGHRVKQVINITDFGHLSSDADEGDDKMTLGLRNEGLELTLPNMKALAEKYTEEYFHDLDELNVERRLITFPRASDYIQEQISLIRSLEEKGYAYATDLGVYFDVAKFSGYGKLGAINLSGLRGGARVEGTSHKKGPLDFILWKADTRLGWQSPWGLGFPGWHIECTAMIFQLLGKQIDIHTGGIEHIPVHHNNEIAQAEAATGKTFVSYWLHNDHITIEGKKISKSLGNTVYVHNIRDHGFSPIALRYWFLTAHYRSPANFTWTALEGSAQALTRLYRLFFEELPKTGHTSKEFTEAFDAAIGNDLDTPKALALMWDMLKDPNITPHEKRGNMLYADAVFGLGLGGSSNKLADMKSLKVLPQSEIPEDIAELMSAREDARLNKDFETADRIRGELKQLGYEIVDGTSGPTLRKFKA